MAAPPRRPRFRRSCPLVDRPPVSAPAARRRRAALPLLVNALVLAIFLFAPLARPLDVLDFHLHSAAREEIVRRVERGELWSGSPRVSAAPLPTEYSRAVSDGSGQRSIVVYREGDTVHVRFFPHPGLGGERSVLLYRSDGREPALPSRYLPDATHSERLGDRWFRVVFP